MQRSATVDYIQAAVAAVEQLPLPLPSTQNSLVDCPVDSAEEGRAVEAVGDGEEAVKE